MSSDETVFGLSRRLDAFLPDTKRKVLANACIHAAERLALDDPQVNKFLAVLRSKGELSKQQARRALSLSEKADERYFMLQDEGAPAEEYLKPFSLARLFRGMGIAFGAAAGEGTADAVYELSKTQDDPSEIVKSIESDMESLPKGK